MPERLLPEERHESLRGYFAYEVHNAMIDNPDIYVVTADLGYGMWDKVKDDFPERFINFGASEQVMLAAAVGLAQENKTVFAYSITPFLLFRGAEGIRNYIDHEQVPVNLIASGRDQDYEHDGFSHFAGDDKKLMEVFPNIQGCWPLTKSDMKYVVKWCVEERVPKYVNLKR